MILSLFQKIRAKWHNDITYRVALRSYQESIFSYIQNENAVRLFGGGLDPRTSIVNLLRLKSKASKG